MYIKMDFVSDKGNKMNWCKFFADIEANPKALVPRLTVREYYEAKQHSEDCDVCNNRVQRVLAKTPKEAIFFGLN